jgi:hypothetical protein
VNYFQSMQPHATLMLPQAPAASTPSAADISRFVAEGLIRPIFEGLRTAATNFTDTVTGTSTGLRPRAHKPRMKDECCDDVDPCHCTCCIVDADLIVHARVGERRVVPLTIENRWRRERKVRVELSNFSTRSASNLAVNGRLQPPGPDFTLPPCGRQELVLIIEASGATDNERQMPDVDNCVVYYADLRVEGCEIRPIRIAVALLPRDCAPYRIECRCQCC